MSPSEHEMQEVQRAFEKYGLDQLLVAADGSVSPHLAVLRLLAFVSERGLVEDFAKTGR